jgi:hypothetical protein
LAGVFPIIQKYITAKRLQDACSTLLASATDASFDDLPDIAFTLLTAIDEYNS